jgi:hypothetical protein
LAFLSVALAAAGDKVAIGILSRLGARDDVVEAAPEGRERAETIETAPAFARVDGMAQAFVAKEVRVIEIDAEIAQGYWARRGHFWMVPENLARQADLDEVTAIGTFDQTEHFFVDEAPRSTPSRVGAQADAVAEPGHGEMQAPLSFEAAMA